jgi:hypothetical protein
VVQPADGWVTPLELTTTTFRPVFSVVTITIISLGLSGPAHAARRALLLRLSSKKLVE